MVPDMETLTPDGKSGRWNDTFKTLHPAQRPREKGWSGIATWAANGFFAALSMTTESRQCSGEDYRRYTCPRHIPAPDSL